MDLPSPLAMLKFAASLLVCLPFIASGIHKLRDFPGAVAEVGSLGLPTPRLVAAGVIALQLAASGMILGGVLTWLAALALAAFTAAATLLGHRWWRLPPDKQGEGQQVFLEHCAIVGGLLLLAHIDLSMLRAAP